MLKWIFSKLLQGKYTVQHRASLNELNKLVEVVMSCQTAAHCDSAIQYVKLYKARHFTAKKEDGYTRTGEKVMEQFLLYLKDTREHVEFGMHYPKNSKAPVAEYPDMNNYVGKVLDVRFKSFWTEGETSVIGPK